MRRHQPFIFDLVGKNIEKLTKRTEKRRAKSKDDSSLVDDDKGDLSIGLSTSQIDSLYSELSPPRGYFTKIATGAQK